MLLFDFVLSIFVPQFILQLLYLFPFILPLLVILLPFLLPSILDILDEFGVFLLDAHDLLMEAFNSGIQCFILDCLFGELLVEEADIGLVLTGHEFLF